MDPRVTPSIEDRIAFDDLYSSYLWALDTKDVEFYVAAFWDDAVLHETQVDGTVLKFEGREAIDQFTRDMFALPEWVGHQHRETTRLYVPEGDSAQERWFAQSYWFTTHRDDPTNSVEILSTGYYRDIVEKRDGEWRFASRWIERWRSDARHPYRHDGIA